MRGKAKDEDKMIRVVIDQSKYSFYFSKSGKIFYQAISLFRLPYLLKVTNKSVSKIINAYQLLRGVRCLIMN